MYGLTVSGFLLDMTNLKVWSPSKSKFINPPKAFRGVFAGAQPIGEDEYYRLVTNEYILDPVNYLSRQEQKAIAEKEAMPVKEKGEKVIEQVANPVPMPKIKINGKPIFLDIGD